ncbi:MAG: tellurite resistance/C4-dicarboxylate transporter family protein [Betaproteobacteria bacterium]
MAPRLAGLSPAYFGLVMATGIVSIAAHQLALGWIAQALFALNVAFYVALWALNALRIAHHRREFLADIVDHARGPGFFTWVAATAVLGAQCAILATNFRIAWALWGLAVVLWALFTYAIFAAFTVKGEKPPLDSGINGAWLLAVVATQSIAVLSSLLGLNEIAPYKRALNFLALSMWLWGGMLYVWLMALIFYRYTFFRLAPQDLTPPYWINMGAMAISTLAGSLLIVNASDAPLLQSLLPFLRGFTIFYWATGTWWIPMLLVLGAWRYVYMRHPLRYDPVYWAAVFPLGMYAAATHEMSLAMDLAFLTWVPEIFFYAALAAWLAAAVGLAFSLARPAAAAPMRND